MIPAKITLLDAIERLKTEKTNFFTVMLKNGTMSVEYFSPKKVDNQTPHSQDELYVIARGHGKLIRNNEKFDCKAGDILFVPAGMEHHFIEFSDDFATWVIFYGPDGGEH